MRFINKRGFSLVELLITTLILSMVIAIAVSSFIGISNFSKIARSVTGATDKVRTSYEIITNDLSMAGNGFKDLNHLDLKFDNGFGLSDMLAIENLSTTNGHSDITINYFNYDPASDENPAFLVGFEGNQPFVGAPYLFSNNTLGELNQLEPNDLYIIYQYAAIADPTLFDPTITTTYWDIPNLQNSGVIVQLSPSGAPENLAAATENSIQMRQRMDYATTGFVPTGAAEWKPLTQTNVNLDGLVSAPQWYVHEGGIQLSPADARQLIFAKKLGSSNSFQTVRYYVDGSNNLIRSLNGTDQVLISEIEEFRITVGLDTSLTQATIVQKSDLDGSVSNNTIVDPSSRWISDTTGVEDNLLTKRHALSARIQLKTRAVTTDRTRSTSDNKKYLSFTTQIPLANTLPRGDLSAKP